MKEFFRTLHKRRWIRFIVYVFIVIVFPIIGIYVHFIEPRLLKITHNKIPIKKLPKSFENFRIAQISDLHFGPTNRSEAFLKKCVEKINNLNPDIVAVTGDFIQWEQKDAKTVAGILSSLQARDGIFAVLGNHDYGICHQNEQPTDPISYEEIIKEFETAGIHVLHNERTALKRGEDFLEIAGLGDYWTLHFKPEKAFEGFQYKIDHHAIILLSHNPDSIFELEAFPFDLMLSGHAHGGQVTIPLIGPVNVPLKHKSLRKGLHKIGNKWLYSNRGLGFVFKMRLLSPPEITCIDLVAA